MKTKNNYKQNMYARILNQAFQPRRSQGISGKCFVNIDR